jgi:UDP-2,4-diacetamido-2,4,6-trideoxy-beta-L-altropyranose hydrolase
VAPIVQAAGFEHRVLAGPAKPDSATVESAASEVHQRRDAEDTVRAVLSDRPSWVVVDHYALAGPWHLAVRSQLGAAIGVIDDLANRPLQADWVLNQNLAVDRSSYQVSESRRTRVLCGLRYALLDAVYADAPRCEVGTDVGSIGIFMGGADQANLSIRALEACREVAHFRGPIEVATTSANPHLAELRRASGRWPETSLLCNAPSLAAFFARHGLQVGAGGGATWERCRVGAPTLLLLAAENQRAVIASATAHGAAEGLEPIDAVDTAAIGQRVSALLRAPVRRRQMSENGRRLVDGLGAHRAALSLSTSMLTVRRAHRDDGVMIHAWRNAEVTRMASFESGEIALEDHLRWLDRVLEDHRRLLLVGHIGPRAIGVIRFDRRDDGWTEVSLYLDPALHGLGLGSALLAAGEGFALSTGAAGEGFVARIRDGNARSGDMFAAASYLEAAGVWRKRGGAGTSGVASQ